MPMSQMIRLIWWVLLGWKLLLHAKAFHKLAKSHQLLERYLVEARLVMCLIKTQTEM